MSAQTLPDPLVPAEVDLRGYEWMPLYGDRLINSETWILASADGKVAALSLWWRAFGHEVPAGSLPSDDRLLAAAAGYGVAVAAWKVIKTEALRGWVLCSDGRYYHPFLAELALQAWETRQADIAKKEAERERKKQKRLAEKGGASVGQTDTVRRTENECPPDNVAPSAGTSAGIPPENALKGKERTGKERSTGIGKSSAGGPRAPAREEARPPAEDRDSGISAAVSTVRQGLTDAFERWFDLPDRPLTPTDLELIEGWIVAGTERGLSPAGTAAAAVAEVQRQFRRLEERRGGVPRSLRAVLDEDVRTAIANIRPARSGAAGPTTAAEVPAPYAGYLTATEYTSWIVPCTVQADDTSATIIAPTRPIRDWVSGQLTEKLRAALCVTQLTVELAAPSHRPDHAAA